MEFKKTTSVPELTLPDGYTNIGINKVYDGEKYLVLNKGKLSPNIPFLFKDSKDNQK